VRRYSAARLLLFAAAGLAVARFGWIWHRVGQGLSPGAWDQPSVLYGRPAVVRPGDHLDNLRLRERLARLSYRRTSRRAAGPGTWSEEPGGRLRIATRGFQAGPLEEPGRTVVVEVRDGRVASLRSESGADLGALRLEPEEIGRILGPAMESRRIVPLSAVPKSLRDAVVAAEDARFFSHRGIDVPGILRAAWANLRHLRVIQGGSTITQQVAKNVFLTPERTLWRKLREMELALFIELRHSKEEILSAYLNRIYFGQEGRRGIYGVEEAARFYFSKGVSDLSLEESALLAAIIRSPGRYSPLRAPRAARERRDWVLSRMRRLGMIDEATLRRALATPVRLAPRRAPVHYAAWYIDAVQRAAEDFLGGEPLHRAGYRFYTSLDPVQQAAAEVAVAQGLAELETSRKTAAEPLQAALVAVDPATGEVTAMVGGRDYAQTQFNRATDARRQPGSAFKPFVLLAAMEEAVAGKRNLSLASPLSGDPITVPTPQGPWSPSNNEGRIYGTITVRRMIEESVNTAAVRLALEVGLPAVVAAARRAGIESPLAPVPAAALGSYEVTPLELAAAYAVLAAGGGRANPVLLHAVTDSRGQVLYAAADSRARAAVDPRAAYLVTSALQGVLDRGTGRGARAAGVLFPAAGKTGTTDGFRDSWFAGYTPEVACVVWVGHDSGRSTGLTGAAGALRIWSRFMRAVYRAAAPRAFPVPEGIAFARIDPASGLLATPACPETLEEAFPAALVPTEPCPLHPARSITDTIRRGLRGLGDFFRNLFR